MKIVDDQGHQYRSKVEAALNGDSESGYYIEEPLHERIDITDEIARFRKAYTNRLRPDHARLGECRYGCGCDGKPRRALPTSPPDGWVTERGWYDLGCFNGLSGDLQRRVVYWGNLPLGYDRNSGRCHNPAEVEITTVHDAMPGPRFYCLPCAVEYLTALHTEVSTDV